MLRPRLFLIDSFGFIFRAFHARARMGVPAMRTSAGVNTEAVYIFHNMVRKLATVHKPEYMAAVFESEGKTFRDEAFAAYKATRTETPPDLLQQIPLIRRVLEAMRIPIVEFPNFEADDVIGALAKRAAQAGQDVVIVSSDKDMLQLVDDHICMLNPAKDDIIYCPPEVETFMGVKPSQVADLLALKGDSVHNIPGAPGIGDKGARELITRFGTVENALEHAAEVEKRMYRESLQNNAAQILLSKQLATIDVTVPVEWNLEAAARQTPDIEALAQIYRELEFFSMLKELGPLAQAETKLEFSNITSQEELAVYLAPLETGAPVAIVMRTAGDGELALSSAGISIKTGEGRALPLEYLDGIRAILEDPARPKITHDVKTLLLLLAKRGINAQGFTGDVMLYSFLLSADSGASSLEGTAQRYLNRAIGRGAEEHAEAAFELAHKLAPQIEAQGLGSLYHDIELPLTAVLARMAQAGICVEPKQLQALSVRMDLEIQRLTAEIHEIAGHPFNINSPQQLGKVLFEELNLPSPVKYGKGKVISTAADILEDLAATYPIAQKVLEYRQLAKLKGTYVDALPALIDPQTGCLHTTLNQTGAATGRLSSSNPNLQNIPIRTELGREIRAAFVPCNNWKMLVADYSQIELRLLAHMSQDPVLLDAFRSGQDIHTRTAAEVFGVPPLMVTPELRRNAKAVNFGIVYGQTPFGLAAQLGIDRKEAEVYIRNYFERYAGVKKFIEKTIAEVRASGVVRTLFGRLRPIPDINSRNPNARGFAERTAVNTPLQGTAADMIKLAMIRIDAELTKSGYKSRMLLQVHDELIFECPPDELDAVKKLVKGQMESAYKLSVPLLVDIGTGDNWRDAK